MFADKIVTCFMGGLSDSFLFHHIIIFALLGVFVCVNDRDHWLTPRAVLTFAAVFAIVALLLRLGVYNNILWTHFYSRLLLFFYGVIGVSLFAAGCLCAAAWYRWHRFEFTGRVLFQIPTGSFRVRAAVLAAAVFLGILFGLADLSWPISSAVDFFSSEILMPGLLWSTVWAFFTYELAFVLLMAGFVRVIVFCLGERQRPFFIRYRSFLLSVFAGIYMAMGGGLLSIFLQRLIQREG
jgi:hypothetical protein